MSVKEGGESDAKELVEVAGVEPASEGTAGQHLQA